MQNDDPLNVRQYAHSIKYLDSPIQAAPHCKRGQMYTETATAFPGVFRNWTCYWIFRLLVTIRIFLHGVNMTLAILEFEIVRNRVMIAMAVQLRFGGVRTQYPRENYGDS